MISMIRPQCREYVLKSSFGFSVEKLPQEQIPADFFQELPGRFTAAELPPYLMENPIQTDGLAPVHACELIETGFLENLSLQFPGLVRDCITGLERNIESLSRKGISAGVLNLDLNVLLSPEKEPQKKLFSRFRYFYGERCFRGLSCVWIFMPMNLHPDIPRMNWLAVCSVKSGLCGFSILRRQAMC